MVEEHLPSIGREQTFCRSVVRVRARAFQQPIEEIQRHLQKLLAEHSLKVSLAITCCRILPAKQTRQFGFRDAARVRVQLLEKG